MLSLLSQDRFERRQFMLLVPLLLALIISGCGFKLRGSVEIPASLKRVYFTSQQQSPSVRATKRLLKSNGVEMVSHAGSAPYHLDILSDTSKRRAATLNSSAKTKQYELRSTLTFQILDSASKTILKPTELIIERVYTFDENNVNAKDAEEALLRREMQDDLARQLVRRYLGLAAR